jgi:TPR repeat protein
MNIKQFLTTTILLLSSAAYGQTDFEETKLLAEQGEAFAQSNLGVMYYKGDGVRQNNVRAYVWWSVAAAQGCEDAKNNRDILSERLTPDERARDSCQVF